MPVQATTDAWEDAPEKVYTEDICPLMERPCIKASCAWWRGVQCAVVDLASLGWEMRKERREQTKQPEPPRRSRTPAPQRQHRGVAPAGRKPLQ